jgi:hypothetical protein
MDSRQGGGVVSDERAIVTELGRRELRYIEMARELRDLGERTMTKAQELGIIKFPYQEFDENGNRTYAENEDGYWEKAYYDEYGNRFFWVNADGHWGKWVYDDASILVYYEDSLGHIWKKEQ